MVARSAALPRRRRRRRRPARSPVRRFAPAYCKAKGRNGTRHRCSKRHTPPKVDRNSRAARTKSGSGPPRVLPVAPVVPRVSPSCDAYSCAWYVFLLVASWHNSFLVMLCIISSAKHMLRFCVLFSHISVFLEVDPTGTIS